MMEGEMEDENINVEVLGEERYESKGVIDVGDPDFNDVNAESQTHGEEEVSDEATELDSSVSESEGLGELANPLVDLVVPSPDISSKDRKEVGFEVSGGVIGLSDQDLATQPVVFLLEGDMDKRFVLELTRRCTVKEAKVMLASKLKLPEENFKLTKDGKQLHLHNVVPSDENVIVIELGLDESEVESSEDDVSVEPSELENQKVIKVQFMGEDGTKKYKEVTVVNEAFSKQYCGGYRNKMTEVVYYNAWSQTNYKVPGVSTVPGIPPTKYYTRETQTLLPLIDEGVDTPVNKCTQMTRKEVYIPNITDKIITARKYEAYDIVKKTMTPFEAVLIIQKAWRRYIKMKRVRDYYKAQADARDAKSQFKGTSLQEFRKHQLTLLTKDSYPITRSDFYDLYSILGEWKKNQLAVLKSNKMGFAYRAAVADLQKQETQGLLVIEDHRMRAATENLQRQDIMFLEGTSRSRVRQYPKGNITIIDDLNIQRAREFKEMFASYKRTDVAKNERIEILMCLKNCLSKFEAVDMTVDLIELLDREVDFIMMGIDESKMTMLRKRFESLYIHLVKNPEFNPQAKYYKKSSETSKKYAMYRCHGCRKVLYPSHLFMHLRLPRFKFCASCNYMNQTATASTNLAPYKRLLTSLRNAEQEKCCRCLAYGAVLWGVTLPPGLFHFQKRALRLPCSLANRTSCWPLFTKSEILTLPGLYLLLLLIWIHKNCRTMKRFRGALSFLLQPWGMYFLVNVLWDGKSIISGSSYLPGLKVTRWLPGEEWSMWNMILLTELEAHKHEQLDNPINYYSKEFVLNVTNRNILGRIHFAGMANIDEKFRNREPLGIVPKDHLLHTTKKAASFLPRNVIHPTLQPSTKLPCRPATKKCDTAN